MEVHEEKHQSWNAFYTIFSFELSYVTERVTVVSNIMQDTLSLLATSHLPSSQWEKQDSQRPPISCVVVGSTAQHLWGCRADRACSQHWLCYIFVHWYIHFRVSSIKNVDMDKSGRIFLTHILDRPTNGKSPASSLQATGQTKVS